MTNLRYLSLFLVAVALLSGCSRKKDNETGTLHLQTTHVKKHPNAHEHSPARKIARVTFPCKSSDYGDGACAILPDGETVLTARIADETIRIVFSTASVPLPSKEARYDPKSLAAFLECTGDSPCSLTLKVAITINGDNIPFGLAMYPYGDIHFASLRKAPNGFMLNIYGGDASTAYIVQNTFAGRRLIEQKYFWGGDPSHAVAVTKYPALPPAK